MILGPGNSVEFLKLEGLDMPPSKNGDQERPRIRGQYIGLDTLDASDIVMTMEVGPPFTTGTLQGDLALLRKATQTQGATEYPLYFQPANGGTLLCTMARCRKRNVPIDIAYAAGNLAQNVVLQFHATDPYWYAAPTLDPSVGLPTPGAGFGFPFTFNLSFGGSSSPNTLTATNNGDVPCYPTLVVTGPCLNPSMQNSSISGAPMLTFDIQLNTGDQLYIDTDLQSCTYYPIGSTQGSSRLNTLVAGSTWWTIPPGSNVISFNSQDVSQVAGTLAVWYSSAYSSAT